MTALLTAEGLSFRYRRAGSAALHSVSLRLFPGEICGLIGPNGAGKTTLISVLTGILPPGGGVLHVCGYNAAESFAPIRRLQGVVPQELALCDRLTCRENLLWFGRLYGLQGKALHSRVEELLALYELSARADAPVSTCSGGMKRRLNLLAGLLHEPQLLFLDEPTAGVDLSSRRLILDSLLARRGTMSILYTSHYLAEVEELCDRVLLMERGRVQELTPRKGERLADACRQHLEANP